MNRSNLIYLIREGLHEVLSAAPVDEYKGQEIVVHDSDFFGDDSWIAFNIKGEVFPGVAEEEAHRIYNFSEDDFANWLEKNEDISDYIEKDYDYDPIEKRSNPYGYFDYKEWKNYNKPENYAGNFLVDMLSNYGSMPVPDYRS